MKTQSKLIKIMIFVFSFILVSSFITATDYFNDFNDYVNGSKVNIFADYNRTDVRSYVPTDIFSIFQDSNNNSFYRVNALDNGYFSEYNTTYAYGWENYTVETKVRMTADYGDSGNGIVIYSHLNDINSKKYYIHIRSIEGINGGVYRAIEDDSTDFICSGSRFSTVVPELDKWYFIKVEVNNEPTSNRVLGKVWQDNETEPSTFDINVTCDYYGEAPEIDLTNGSVGLYATQSLSDFDYINISNVNIPIFSLGAISVTINSPADEESTTLTNGVVQVNFTPIFDENNGQLECQYFIGETGSSFFSVINDTINSINLTDFYSNNYIYLNCSDGLNSEISSSISHYYEPVLIDISYPENEANIIDEGSLNFTFTAQFDSFIGDGYCYVYIEDSEYNIVLDSDIFAVENNTETTVKYYGFYSDYLDIYFVCGDSELNYYTEINFGINYTALQNCADLQAINDNLDNLSYIFNLTRDIDCQGYDWSTLGISIGNPFSGTFYGNNHSIKNLFINGSNLNPHHSMENTNWGLFGYIYGANIQDLIIDSPYLVNIGGFSSFAVAYSRDSYITNVHIINGTAILGCVNSSNQFDSVNCQGGSFGGLISEMDDNNQIYNSSVEANVYVTTIQNDEGLYIGDFGSGNSMFTSHSEYPPAINTTIDGCYTKGNFISTINETNCSLYLNPFYENQGINLLNFATFGYYIDSIVNNSYSLVNVNISQCGFIEGGGFIDTLTGVSIIDNSFWSGYISADNIINFSPLFNTVEEGAIIGDNVFWNSEISGWNESDYGTPLTTEDFSNLTLLGFDPEIWEIINSMPVLIYQQEEELLAEPYSLSVVINYPANETESSNQPIINYTTLSTFTSTINCSLYINGTFDMIDEAVVNNTPSYFNPTLDLGLSTYYIECSDGNNTNTSATYTYTLTSGVNQAPVFTEINITVQFPSRSDFSLQINVTDLDNDTLTYSIGEFIEGEFDPTDYNNSLHTFNMDSSTGLLTRTARNGSQATAYKYSINVTDGTDMVSTWIFAEMSDVYADVNTYSETPNPSYRGNAIDYNLTCVDVDDDDIYYICQIYNGTEVYGSMVATLYANNSNVNICSLPSNTANKGETWKAQLGCSLWNDFFDTNEIWGNPNGTVNTTGITISNTAPVFTQSNFNYSMLDNESLSLQINVTDVDNDAIQFTSNNPMFPIDLNSGIITNNSLISGNYTVQINITDGTEITSMEINFEIIYTNKPPVLVEVLFEPNVAFRDTQLNFSLLCTDVDNENLTGFAQVYNGTEEYNGVISLPIFNNTLTMITYIPTLTTHKGEIWHADMWCSDDIFTTTIASTNNSTTLNSDPVPSITPTTNLSDNEIIHVDFNTTDLDQDTLNYSSDSPYFPIGYSTGIISNNHAPEGFYNVTFSVSDGTTTVYQWSTFYVTRNNYQPDTNTYTSTALNFSILCIDNNNINITGYCQIYNNTETYDGLINLTVINNTLTPICDVEAGIVKKGETWYANRWCSDGVYNTSVYNGTGILILNSAPYFEQYDFTYFGLDNEIISLQINATDLDEDILQFESNDTLFPINSSTGLITTDLVSVGTYNVSINVTDGTDSDEMWVMFDIESGNSAPVLTVQFPTNNSKSLSSLSFNYSFVDNESSSLNCLLYIDSVNTENKTTDNNTLTAWNPTFAYGNHSYSVKCTDGTYETSSPTRYYAYYYTQSPVVTINSPANETKSGTALTINYTATNPNINNLTCTVYRGGSVNVTQTATNGTSKTASPTMNKGTYLYSYYVNCTDGLNVGLSETRTFLYSNYTNGTGTTDNPFLITNCTDLQNMKDGLYSSYALANDINCSATSTWNVGKGFIPVGSISTEYSGLFDGMNYTISNLYMNNQTSYLYEGLFGVISNTSQVRNIKLTSVSISIPDYPTGAMNVGVLAGWNKGIITNVSITGVIGIHTHAGNTQPLNIGGITGYNTNLIQFSNSDIFFSDWRLGSGTTYVGGFTGNNNGGFIKQSYTIPSFTTSGDYFYVGGMVGTGGIVNNSYAKNSVTSMIYHGEAGGLVGQSTSIYNSYGYGSITVRQPANSGYPVYLGEFGARSQTNINSHIAVDISCTGTGCNINTASGSGSTFNTFAELQSKSLYANWDFVTVWKWDNTLNLPVLRQQGDLSGYYPEGNVTINSPANNTISPSSPVINFTVNSGWASTTNCTLYLNSVANATINNVNNNTLTSFTPSLSYGNNSYYVSCIDGWNTMNTASRNYIYYENNIPSVTATAYTPPTAYTNNQLLFNSTCEHNDIYTDGITAHCQLYNGTTAYNSEITKTVTNNTNTNICNVSANIVKKDETWKAQFFCSDNISNGSAVNSSAITISNTAPVYTQSNFVYATLDNESINLQINATDLDNDALTYSINDTNFAIGSSSGIITKTTAIGEEYNVSVNVTDGTATTTMWVYFDIEVSNYAPELIGTDAQPTTAYKDTQLNFSVQCTEVDDEILNGECQLYNGTTAYGSVIENAVYNNTMSVVCSLPANTGNKGETWKAELWCNDGGMNSNKTNSSGITLLNTIPSINFNSPANNSITYRKEKINFTVSDVDFDNLTCSLYIDNYFNSTNSSVQNNITTLFTPIWSYGNHTFYINCSDGTVNTLTGIYNFEFQVPPYYYWRDDFDGDTARLTTYNWTTDGNSQETGGYFRSSATNSASTILQNFSDNINFQNQSWNIVTQTMKNGGYGLTETAKIYLGGLYINLEGAYSGYTGDTHLSFSCSGECSCTPQDCYTGLSSNIFETIISYNASTKILSAKKSDGCSISTSLSSCNLENQKISLYSSTYKERFYDFKISNSKINFAPLFNNTEITYAVKDDEAISIQLNATDFNQDTLTFSTINAMFPISSSGLITNNSVAVGDYVVEYNVTDGTESDTLIVNFNVTLSNTAPNLTSTNAQPTTAYTNDRLNFSVTCTDDQSETLTAYCQIYNGTATYDSLSSVNISKDIETQVCYVPLNTVKKGESWNAELSCSDGMFITESQNTSSITISNTAPTFTSPDFTHYMSNRDSISIQLNATDLDGDSLTFSTINTMFPISSSGLITNNSVAVGDYVVTYNVTDGTASDSLTATYNISLGNTAPTLTNVSSRPTTSYKNTELTFSLTCADITNTSVVGYCQIYNDTTPYSSLDLLLVSVNTQTDVCVLPANTGNKDESWKAELWCGDGEFNSSSSYTDSITLLNTAPVYTESNFIITHHTTEDLSLQINATDLDSDSLTYSINDTNFEIGSSSGLITRTGQASTTAGTYNVSVSINDGDTTVTMWVYFILTQVSPIIIISNPINESVKTEPFDISFTVTDSDTPTTDCFAYLDSVSLANVSSVVNNTPTLISTSFSVGNHNVYITCNDGIATSTSGVYSFYYDDTAVVINSFAPNIFNTTIFAGYTMTVSGNVTASELSLVSRTIYYPNSTILFNEEQTVFGDSTFYNWSESYTTSDYPNGIYTMNIYAEDVYSHSNNKDITFEIGNCVPEWICNSYDTCGITDTQACDGVADSNTCGVVYTGDYSEFDDINCNYCSRNIVTANQTTCTLNLQTITYEDLNFATCCDVTGIGTDCYNDIVQNVSTYTVEQSCNAFDYQEEDVPKALWNTVVKFVLSFKSLI